MQFLKHATWQVPLISFHDAGTFLRERRNGFSPFLTRCENVSKKVQLLGKWRWRRKRCNNIKNRIHGTEREHQQQKRASVKRRIQNCEFSLWQLPKCLQHLDSMKNRWKSVLWKIIMNGTFKCFIFPHVFLQNAPFSIPPVAGEKLKEKKTFLLSLKFLFYFLINVLPLWSYRRCVL